MNETETLERVEEALLPESDLVPLALIAIEVGETVDRLAGRFADDVQLDDIGMRSVRADVAREFFTARAEQKARQNARQRRRAEEAEKKKVAPRGVPGQEGMTAVEALMAAEQEAGTYTRPQDDLGPGRGNPTQELFEEELAKGRRKQAEKRRLADERRKERLAKQMKEDLK